jgi:hypothetical protein
VQGDPVDVVPICNECVGREGERSLQQFSANRGRQELKAGFCREENIVSAGAGVNQQPKLRRQLIQSRHCGHGPWLAQTATVRGGERKRISHPGFQSRNMELPERPAGIGALSGYTLIANLERRSRL